MGFPEFTAKLITDTFNAITASYIEQMGQYMNLVQAVSQTLAEFIKNTAADVSADEIAGFLVGLRLNDAALNFLLGDSTAAASLSAEAKALDEAVALPAPAGAASPPVVAGNLSAAKKQAVELAVSRRIASNRYELLQTMVRQGVLRLYVDNGTIETRITFSTYGNSSAASSSTKLARALQLNSSGGLGGVGFAGFGGVAAGAFGAGGVTSSSRATLNVSTAKESQRDVSGSRVQVFGRVRLNFKTDFVPLAAPGA
jgi:hypothetical protein